MDLRRREHARSVSVVVSRRAGRVSVRRERCEFVGGRDDLAGGGGCRLFGGADGDHCAPVPAWPARDDDVEERLRDFAGWIGGDVVLQHHAVTSGRTVVAGGGSASERIRAVFALTGHASENGRTLPIGVSGRGNGLEVLEDRRLAAATAWTRAMLAAASGPLGGGLPAVLSSQAAAVLVHEAVGHYAEAMHVGAPAVHRLFTRIAAERLSAVDRPDVDGDGENGRHDDEGVLSLGATEIVRGGVLVAQLHSRATARAAATAPTGNARAALVWDPPIPRISNLVCGVGDRSEDALIDDLPTGVYIHRLADGYRQGTRISARVVLGEHIKRGRRTGRHFTGSHVDGRIGLFTDLVELGDRAERNPNAMCGKDGQLLFDVATIAPAMSLSTLSLVS